MQGWWCHWHGLLSLIKSLFYLHQVPELCRDPFKRKLWSPWDGRNPLMTVNHHHQFHHQNQWWPFWFTEGSFSFQGPQSLSWLSLSLGRLGTWEIENRKLIIQNKELNLMILSTLCSWTCSSRVLATVSFLNYNMICFLRRIRASKHCSAG